MVQRNARSRSSLIRPVIGLGIPLAALWVLTALAPLASVHVLGIRGSVWCLFACAPLTSLCLLVCSRLTREPEASARPPARTDEAQGDLPQ